jgi:hypothetical protein
VKLQLKFDKKSIQQFFVDHSEKIVLGVVAACFLFVAYQALTRKGFRVQGQSPQDSKPENLEKAVDAAKAQIAKPTPKGFYDPKLALVDFDKIVTKFRAPVDPKEYALLTALDHPIVPKRVLRGMPAVLPVEKLQAVAGRGPVALAGGGGGPVPPKKTGRAAAQGRRWVLVKGLVPLKKQTEEYKGAFQDASVQDPQRDVPVYVGFLVQRAEVTPGSSAAPEWDTFYTSKTLLDAAKKWPHPAEDPVSDRFERPEITMPLPPLTDRTWGKKAALLPEIPLLEAPAPGEPPPDDGDQTPPAPHAKGHAGAAKTEGANEPDYLLLRFFDFGVEPGKEYQYRVFLVLRNPNLGLPSNSVADSSLTELPWVGVANVVQDAAKHVVGVRLNPNLGNWSDPCPPAAVPEDVQLLATSPAKPHPGQEPIGGIRLTKWLEPLGIVAWHSFDVVRGQIADFPADPNWDSPLGKKPVACDTDDLIVDLSGEMTSRRERLLTRPHQVLVLEKSGNLVIHDEVADDEVFRKAVPPRVAPEPAPKTKEEPEIHPKVKPKPDFDVPDDVFGGPHGKPAGKR